MPIIQKVGNLLEDVSVEVILHQANLFHTFGGGIAAAIKDAYPAAYDADCATPHGDEQKLGTYSRARCPRSDGTDVVIVNCYSQTGMGAKDRNTSYNDIYTIFSDIEEKIRSANELLVKRGKKPLVVGIPYRFGCGLAGGKWRIVLAIVEEVFKNSPVTATIIRLASEPEINLD